MPVSAGLDEIAKALVNELRMEGHISLFICLLRAGFPSAIMPIMIKAVTFIIAASGILVT